MSSFSKTSAQDDPIPQFEMIELQLSYDLAPMVNEKSGVLLTLLQRSRQQVAAELGVVFPPIHVCDNLALDSGEYHVLLRGVSVCKVETKPGKMLAIDSGEVCETIDGAATTEPAFGLAAVWIEPERRAEAENLGYTPVDIAALISTHLTEIIKQNLPDLLGLSDTKKLLDTLALSQPELVAEAMERLSLRDVLRVLRALLAEHIPIRDLEAIVDTLAEHAEEAVTITERLDLVRKRLLRK